MTYPININFPNGLTTAQYSGILDIAEGMPTDAERQLRNNIGSLLGTMLVMVAAVTNSSISALTTKYYDESEPGDFDAQSALEDVQAELAAVRVRELVSRGLLHGIARHSPNLLWTQLMEQMSYDEGWGLFNLGDRLEDLRVERDDGQDKLADEAAAWKIVRDGTGEHHQRARELLAVLNPREYADLMRP